jgi:hypothetical protein
MIQKAAPVQKFQIVGCDGFATDEKRSPTQISLGFDQNERNSGKKYFRCITGPPKEKKGTHPTVSRDAVAHTTNDTENRLETLWSTKEPFAMFREIVSAPTQEQMIAQQEH